MVSVSIDWNEVWKELRARRTTVQRNASTWGKRAAEARRINRDMQYARDFLDLLKPRPEWTVLDMGCGDGTLAIPLAPLVAHVTAADFSGGMLELVQQECDARGITSITTKKLAWEDDWQTANVGTYDVAIASRSLMCDDLREGITKLDAAARRKVVICTVVGDGPFDRKVFEALGRELHAGPDYMCNVNLLHQMGILARMDFILQDCRTYESRDDFLGAMLWMIDDISRSEHGKLEAFADTHLVREGDHWVTDYERVIPWAVLWWDKG